jgi:hypothetical protein
MPLAAAKPSPATPSPRSKADFSAYNSFVHDTPDSTELNLSLEPIDAAPEPRFSVHDVNAIIAKRGWLVGHTMVDDETFPLHVWFARALTLLGPKSPTLEHLEGLLALVFEYNAAANLELPENRAVLVRTGAREVIRELANRIFDGGGISSSERFKEIVDAIKAAVPFRSRVIFHPLRLALAGRTGEGELDRVILLLDSAAQLPFTAKVKDTRERMLEFCAALD